MSSFEKVKCSSRCPTGSHKDTDSTLYCYCEAGGNFDEQGSLKIRVEDLDPEPQDSEKILLEAGSGSGYALE